MFIQYVQRRSLKDLSYAMVAKSEHPSSVVRDCASLKMDREIILQAASLAFIQDQGLITGDITLVSDETQNLWEKKLKNGVLYFTLPIMRCSTPPQPLNPMRVRSSFHFYTKSYFSGGSVLDRASGDWNKLLCTLVTS